MPLTFEPQSDGFRVIKDGYPIARATTMRRVSQGEPGYDELFEEWWKKEGKTLFESRACAPGKKPRQMAEDAGPVFFVDLPLDECHVHSVGGPLKVGDSREIEAKLQAK